MKVPRIGSDIGEEAAKLVQAAALDNVTDVLVVDQSASGHLQVVLFPSKTEKDWTNSVNCQLIKKGLAALTIGEDEEYPEEVNGWFKFEEEAREEATGLWQFGGANDLDDDN